MVDEEWRPVPDTEGRYEVSTHGRIRSVRVQVLNPVAAGNGYLRFSDGARRHNIPLHREICRAFHGEPPFEGAIVRHLDGDRLNNRPENLKWGTYKENAQDKLLHGTQIHGARAWNATLTEDLVREIRRMSAAGLGRRRIAAALALSASAVGHVLSGKTWRHVA